MDRGVGRKKRSIFVVQKSGAPAMLEQSSTCR